MHLTDRDLHAIDMCPRLTDRSEAREDSIPCLKFRYREGILVANIFGSLISSHHFSHIFDP